MLFKHDLLLYLSVTGSTQPALGSLRAVFFVLLSSLIVDGLLELLSAISFVDRVHSLDLLLIVLLLRLLLIVLVRTHERRDNSFCVHILQSLAFNLTCFLD